MMAWTKHSIIIFAFFIAGGAGQDFFYPEVEHLRSCYNYTDLFSPNYHRPPQSLDNLLAIIERIEDYSYFSSLPAKQIALYILSRFRIDGIEKATWFPNEPYPIDPWTRNMDFRLLQDMQMKFINKLQSTNFISYPVNFLSLDEKCALHWMVSHGLNLTRREEERSNTILTPPPWARKKRQVLPNDQYTSRYPLEVGVIQTKFGTVASAYVLAGIATAFDAESSQRMQILDFISVNTGTSGLSSYYFDVRYGNLGALAAAADKPKKVGAILLGPDGWWNCSYCPGQFTLSMLPSYATDSQIYGSLDGYFIAKRLKATVPSQYNNMKLSQILRMYYNKGIFGELRACNRFKMLSDELSDGSSSLADFKSNMASLIVIQAYNHIGNTLNIESAPKKSEELIANLKGNYTNNNVNAQKMACEDTLEQPEIIPTVDLYVVADTAIFRDTSRMTAIATLLGRLGDLLDISSFTSHIGLYVNDERHFSEILPMNRSISEADFKCKVKWLDPTQFGYSMYSNNLEMIRKLKEIINNDKYSEDNRKNITTPGKVVLFVTFANGNERVEDTRWEMSLFRKDHPDVEFLMTGSRIDTDRYLKDSRTDFLNFDTSDPYTSITHTYIYERLKKVGSTIYAPECADINRPNYVTFTSYIANNTRKLHTMYSNMFNLSKSLKIEAKAYSYPLKICISRGIDIVQNNFKGECFDMPFNGPTQIVYNGEPCEHVDCSPIYLLVTAGAVTTGQTPQFTYCQDKKQCRTADMVPYTISITGARCGSTVNSIAVGLLTLCLFISSFIKNYIK